MEQVKGETMQFPREEEPSSGGHSQCRGPDVGVLPDGLEEQQRDHMARGNICDTKAIKKDGGSLQMGPSLLLPGAGTPEDLYQQRQQQGAATWTLLSMAPRDRKRKEGFWASFCLLEGQRHQRRNDTRVH